MSTLEAIIAVVLIGGCIQTGAAAAWLFWMLDKWRMKNRQ